MREVELSVVWAWEVPCTIVPVLDGVIEKGDSELERELVAAATELATLDSVAVIGMDWTTDVGVALSAVVVGVADTVMQELSILLL